MSIVALRMATKISSTPSSILWILSNALHAVTYTSGRHTVDNAYRLPRMSKHFRLAVTPTMHNRETEGIVKQSTPYAGSHVDV
jgi:hypothetical protein